jgi:hypothetical protein
MANPPLPPAIARALDTFLGWTERHPGAIAASVSFEGRGPGVAAAARHAVVVFAQHGDEWGTLPAVVEVLPLLREQVEAGPRGGRVTVILGNLDALRINDRWVREDLNRCYPAPGEDERLPPGDASDERLRAHVIARAMRDADLVVDLHQTSQPTRRPFFVFPFHRPSVALAQALRTTDVLLTRDPGPIDETGRCIDDFCHARDVPTVAIEVGCKGENAMTRACVAQVLQAVAAQVGSDGDRAAREPAPIRLLHVTRRFGFGSRGDAVAPGLDNLAPVLAGMPLVTGLAPALAPGDGVVFFMQRPPRDAAGHILGVLPKTAICFAETYVPKPDGIDRVDGVDRVDAR